MKKQAAGTYAAIDIGSNSTKFVVARCTYNNLDILQADSSMVRLGESEKATGEIAPAQRDAVLAALRHYQSQARQYEATTILVVATEAIRRARNKDAFLADIQRETGLQVTVLTATLEAVLTFYGATYAAPTAPDTGVLDVGGGSSELIIAHQMHIAWLTSLPVGSGWLHDQYLSSDPPAQNELDEARKFLRAYMQGIQIPDMPSALVVTGSSAHSLLQLAQQALRVDRSSSRLTREDLLGCEGLLEALPAAEIARRYGQALERARVLPAGALIMLGMMDRLHLNEIYVSAHGLHEGVLLAYTRYGEDWLNHPDIKIDEARQAQAPSLPLPGATNTKTFLESARQELPKRAKKFLKWRVEVLKNEDVEAVHKMRVASRRLRATLDAYEAACKPRLFKQVYRRVKKAADHLGVVRDTDVMLQRVRERLEQAPSEEQAGIQWFLARLSAYHKEQQVLETFLQNFDERTFKRKVRACIQEGAPSDGQS